MQDISTDELEKLLNKTDPNKLDTYLKDNRKYFKDEKKGFTYYVKELLADKNRKLKDVYLAAGVSESFGSKILSMEKHTKDRDLILRLCIAGHFNLQEINRALKLYGMTELYAKDPRDACIIVAINHRMYELSDIDELLEQHGMVKISSDKE